MPDAPEVEIHFPQPYISAEEALAHLRSTRAPPPGWAWEGVRMVRMDMNADGVTFRFRFTRRKK